MNTITWLQFLRTKISANASVVDINTHITQCMHKEISVIVVLNVCSTPYKLHGLGLYILNMLDTHEVKRTGSPAYRTASFSAVFTKDAANWNELNT